MEYAILINRLSDLKTVSDLNKDRKEDYKFTRLYFGTEFCEKLIHSTDEIKDVIKFAKDNGLELTLLTPYVTDKGLVKLKKIFDILENNKEEYEIIVNDYGVLHMLNMNYKNLQPIIGRVLNHMKKDPRIKSLLRYMEKDCKEYLENSCLNSFSIDVLKNIRINRVEYDIPLHGVSINLAESNLSASVYTPYVFLSTTRLCMTKDCEKDSSDYYASLGECQKECQKYTFELKNDNLELPVILKGNTQFYINDICEKKIIDMKKSGVDRIIFQPKVPI